MPIPTSQPRTQGPILIYQNIKINLIRDPYPASAAKIIFSKINKQLTIKVPRILMECVWIKTRMISSDYLTQQAQGQYALRKEMRKAKVHLT